VYAPYPMPANATSDNVMSGTVMETRATVIFIVARVFLGASPKTRVSYFFFAAAPQNLPVSGITSTRPFSLLSLGSGSP
jgi:hypothetical protein